MQYIGYLIYMIEYRYTLSVYMCYSRWLLYYCREIRSRVFVDVDIWLPELIYNILAKI